MGSGQRLPAKKDVVLALLENSDVFVHLDPRRENVRVPAWFKNQPHLVLQIGLNMPVPIRDLEVDESSVSCTLSFNRSPFFCYIPWPAVYALVGSDGRAMVWPDDIPPEVAAQAAKAAQAPQSADPKKDRKKHLRSVKSESTDEVDESAPPEGEPVEKVAKVEPIKKRTLKPAAGAERESDDVPNTDLSSTRASAPPSEPPEPPEKGKKPLPPYLRIVK
jgi:hypothetical protein